MSADQQERRAPDPCDEEWDEDDGREPCECDGDGFVIVCIDDMCRGSGGCGRVLDPSCYAICRGCYP